MAIPAHHKRFRLIGLAPEERLTKFTRDVRRGLTAATKHLPCCYFYDRLGSLLFEAICETREYYLTRAETAILRAHADEIAALVPMTTDVIELGSGNAAKTRLLIDAFLRQGATLRYVPVDICHTVLEESSQSLLMAYPTLEVLAIAGDYHEGLASLPTAEPRRKLVLWLGSNLGNLDRAAAARFLARIRPTLRPDDRLLIGIDLRKDPSTLEAAYDDACGVTAAFNRNILARINTELGGHFDLRKFQHRATYHEGLGKIEMHLVSTTAQAVAIERLQLEVAFAAGEMIHTEDSYKYSAQEIKALASAAGMRCERSWLSPDHAFSLTLFGPAFQPGEAPT